MRVKVVGRGEGGRSEGSQGETDMAQETCSCSEGVTKGEGKGPLVARAPLGGKGRPEKVCLRVTRKWDAGNERSAGERLVKSESKAVRRNTEEQLR